MQGSGLKAAATFVLLTASLSQARGDDWPQWLGPERDGVWRETGVLDKFPTGGPTVRWRVPIGAGYAGPAVAGGRVYVMDRQLAPGAHNPSSAFTRAPNTPGTERVLCLNATDGKVVWTHAYDCPYTISYPLGPRTTPAIRDGRVYTLGSEGNLQCLNADTGVAVWARELKKDYQIKAPLWGFSSHPLLDGQKLICVVGGPGSTVVAFDKDTGKELWKALTAREPGYCPPMIYTLGGKRQLIVWDSDAIHGLNPENGSVYWTQPVKTFMAMAIATPRQLGDSLFITATGNTAQLLRIGLDKPGAEVVWRGDPKKLGLFSVYATPFYEGGYIYGASTDGKLVCIKADTGERLWETMEPYHGKKAACGDPFLVKNGDRYFVSTDQGDLIIARLSPKGYEEISRAHLLEPTAEGTQGRVVVWSHPAYADRCVFMRNDKEIICVSLAAGEK
jgi:outer membrane protein assembly factor BamB